MDRGAPEGNLNRLKGRLWREALFRALEIRAQDRKVHRNVILQELADKLICAVELGEPWAIKEFADRLEGKPVDAEPDDNADRDTRRLVING